MQRRRRRVRVRGGQHGARQVLQALGFDRLRCRVAHFHAHQVGQLAVFEQQFTVGEGLDGRGASLTLHLPLLGGGFGRRLEVDNTHRTLHGALMDAELLAEVYINMTRGQDALLIDADGSDGDGAGQGMEAVAIDFSAFELPVLQPTAEEAEAFGKALQDLDKASGGKVVWKTLEAVI